MTFKIDEKELTELDLLAVSRKRTRSELIREAIRLLLERETKMSRYVSVERWRIR